MLGQVKKVVVSKDDTVLLDGAGSSDAIQERIVQVCLLYAYEHTTNKSWMYVVVLRVHIQHVWKCICLSKCRHWG
jgi:hypothetical protein